MIVNDGSTDRTAEIINNFKNQDSRFRVLDLETSEHSPGAKVVRTFDKGLQALDWKDFDVVCKYDADIVFPTNYLEKIKQTFETNPKAGIVSGLVYIKKYKSNSEIKNLRNPNENWLDFSNKNNEWVFENLSSKNHVRGPIKAYRKECFETMIVNDGESALLAVETFDPNLILLDLMLPGIDGYQVCREVRVKHTTPIIMLSAKSEATDKILGLSLGADDYVTKPFDPSELVARVTSQLRRYLQLGVKKTDIETGITVGGLILNTDTKTFLVDGNVVKLTVTEFKILELLMSNPNIVFSAEQIYERVWQETAHATENAVMVHVRRIREKIEINPKEPKYLKVVWGVGYKIEKNS